MQHRGDEDVTLGNEALVKKGHTYLMDFKQPSENVIELTLSHAYNT